MAGRAKYPEIVSDPRILGGKPHVRGTRLSVGFLLELVASGASHDDIVRTYPELTPRSVEQALRWAAENLDAEVVVPARTGR